MELRVLYLVSNEIAANKESIGIVAEHYKEESSYGKCGFKVSPDSSGFCPTEILVIVSYLSLLLAESLDHSDCI